ncbi:YsnF/AvaK domain-containing protein [Belnapia sp. F-4-1]|uniref:YsnF/AvaK domain-containing protein n=1 Tax=Belnapia sp. F-4-1 TaxID=1545443 RepID=UPI0009DEDDFD|nr:YsnF/AvaK domain-containing protein [Belnapia sp. F-4-1]
MTQTTLTALYDRRGDADTAAERLVTEAGLAQSDIAVTAQEAGQDPDAAERGGFLASLKNLFEPEQDRRTYVEAVSRGGFLMTVRVEQRSAEQAMDILEEHGAVDLDDRQQSWRTEGLSSQQAAGAAALADDTVVTAAVAAPQQVPATAPAAALVGSRSPSGDEKIELVEESLRIDKRAVGGGRVRVRSYVVETPVEESVSLRKEHVEIERRPMDRAPTAADEALFAERVIEATETGEEAIIAKDARVTEEVVVRKDVEERVETVHDKLRHTEVEVDDTRATDAEGNATAPASSSGRLDSAPRR